MRIAVLALILGTLGACASNSKPVPEVAVSTPKGEILTLTGRLSTRIHTGKDGVVWSLKDAQGRSTEVLLSLANLESKYYPQMSEAGLGSTVKVSGEFIKTIGEGRLIARKLRVLEP
jgi:hypothetical protein